MPEEQRPSVEQIQHGVRLLRGAIEKIVTATVGRDAKPIVTPTEPASPAWDPAAHATIHLGKVLVGVFGVLSAEAMRCVDLDVPVVAADINIEQLVTRYPPRVVVSTLPAFPGIERDLSVVIPEQVAWAQVEEAARAVGLELMEGVAFVTTYRGKQLPAGCKSLTLRASFRDPTRTLRREEADTQMERLQTVLKERFGAEVRA